MGWKLAQAAVFAAFLALLIENGAAEKASSAAIVLLSVVLTALVFAPIYHVMRHRLGLVIPEHESSLARFVRESRQETRRPHQNL